MAEDALESVIGAFGKYQTWMFILIAVGRYPTEFQLTNVVFLLPSVDYVCLDSDAYNVTNHCPCANPQYDESTIVNSVTSEFHLICDRRALASLAQSMLQIGILFGSLILGHISDSYGRKLAVLLSQFVTALAGTVSALVPHFWMFMVARFLIGVGVGGTMLCCYVFLIELCGKSFRPYMAGLHEISMVTGYFILAVIAYFVREWRHLQLVTSTPWLYVVIYYWLLPESPRWLITVGKTKEAVDILTKVAKRNGRPTDNIVNVVEQIQKESQSEKNKQKGNYLDLFKSPKLRLYTIINVLVWMFCAHTFFGVNQYIGRLDGNIYINVMLSAVFLAPGVVYVVVATRFFKRRPTIMTSFSVAAISLLILIFIPRDMHAAMLAFAIIGQVGAYSSFIQIYLFSSEVFPTVVRNSAMGIASVFARVGSFVAPFVVNMQLEWASLAIFSFLAFTAAFLCYLLPETKGIVLMNSIEQSERFENKTKITSDD